MKGDLITQMSEILKEKEVMTILDLAKKTGVAPATAKTKILEAESKKIIKHIILYPESNKKVWVRVKAIEEEKPQITKPIFHKTIKQKQIQKIEPQRLEDIPKEEEKRSLNLIKETRRIIKMKRGELKEDI